MSRHVGEAKGACETIVDEAVGGAGGWSGGGLSVQASGGDGGRGGGYMGGHDR